MTGLQTSDFNKFQSERIEDAAFYSDLVHALEDASGGTGETPYGATKTAELQVQFAIDPTYGLTKKRYGWFSNEVFFDETFFEEFNGKIRMETSATTGDIARLRSAFPGQYTAHTLSEPGVGARIPDEHLEYDDDGYVSLTHGEISIEIAQWDADAGSAHTAHGISYEPDGAYHQVRAGGQNINFTRQDEWNIDKMDGDGPSETVLRPDRGYVYLFLYTWYGEGAYILAIQDSRTNEIFPVHIYPAVDDNLPSVVDSPNMPLSVTVENNETADPLECIVGGMQYATHGGSSEEVDRQTQETRRTQNGYIDTNAVTDADDAVDPFAEAGVPLISLRRDESNLRAKEGLKVTTSDAYVNCDSDVWLFVFDEYDTSTALTGASFNKPSSIGDPAESQIVTDTSSTAYTPTEAVLRGMTFIASDNKGPVDIVGEARTNLPLRGTAVFTAALAPNATGSTDALPILVEATERY